MNISTKDKIRFESKIEFEPDNTECHIWIASKQKTGHGMFSYKGKTISSQRFSYMMHNGIIGAGQIVHSNCNNPFCVNPKHLILQTVKENKKNLHTKKNNTSEILKILNKIKQFRPDLISDVDNLVGKLMYVNSSLIKDEDFGFTDYV